MVSWSLSSIFIVEGTSSSNYEKCIGGRGYCPYRVWGYNWVYVPCSL